ncbi:MAG: low molecular weight phosphatase family protein [Candidatus Competibacteraceae bacterium]|nr:low molecular weight phosphatase family protein [Candidatus Competibacteraceae bacterium]
MKNLLFLCTGNYYRSRFCELYFNHRAARRELSWRADSRGLAPDITVFRNPGPLSPYTHKALQTLGIALDEKPRRPLTVYPADFLSADRIIALSRREHEPMVRACFPSYEPRVEYWEVGDIAIESPARAIDKMIELVEALLTELQEPGSAKDALFEFPSSYD